MTEISATYTRKLQIEQYEPVTESATFETEIADDASDAAIREEYRRLRDLAEEEVERALADRIMRANENDD